MSNAGKLEGRPFRRRRHVALVLLVIAVSLLATSIPARANAQDSGGNSNKSTPEYTKWDDLSGKTVGMVTGATFENALREKCPSVGDGPAGLPPLSVHNRSRRGHGFANGWLGSEVSSIVSIPSTGSFFVWS